MAGNYNLGRESQVYICNQNAWGTLVWPVAGDAIKHMKCSMQRKETRKLRADVSNTRSRQPTIIGKHNASCSLNGYIIPSGSVGVVPNTGKILKAAFGVETVNPGVSVVYSLARDLETLQNGLSIHQFGSFMHEAVRDAIVQGLTIKLSGAGEGEFDASFDAAEEVLTGSSTLQNNAAGGANSVTVAAGDGVNYSVGSVVDIGTSTGHTITAIAGDALSITPNLVGNQNAGVAVIPNRPGATTVGAPISGIIGQFQIDAVTISIISAQVKLANKSKMRDNEYGTAAATGFSTPVPREITFDLELYLRKDYLKFYGHARQLVQKALTLTSGGVAGNRLVLSLPKVEFEIPPIDISGADEAVIKISGSALPTTVEDEITATFN